MQRDSSGHGQSDARATQTAETAHLLGGAFWIAAGILLAELAGALASHSLALLSDAGHMLADVLALALAWYASRLSGRPATPQRTYGFHRAGILAALFNAAMLLLIAAGIVAAAVGRLRHPTPVAATIMWPVALVGLVGNLLIGSRLGHGHAAGHLHVRSAWLHAVGDAAASAGVLGAALVILVTHWLWIDPAVSMAVACLIAWGARRIVVETIDILMEGVPRGIDPDEVLAAMTTDPDIVSAHHVHIWALGSGLSAMSGHLVMNDAPLSDAQTVMRRVAAQLEGRFRIQHTTLQIETGDVAACGTECGGAAVARDAAAHTGWR